MRAVIAQVLRGAALTLAVVGAAIIVGAAAAVLWSLGTCLAGD